jgi:anti-sigma factor RsiW
MRSRDRNTEDDIRCRLGFRQVMLTGYLDGELSQGDAQRVRVHLDDCDECRRLYDEMAEMRKLTRSTAFRLPTDDQWRELPTGGVSRLARGLGWVLLIIWSLLVLGFAGWQLAVSPENLFLKVMIFAGGLGIALVFLSVLLDRLRHRRTDRYDRVEK